jgi:hypothetical protein
MPYRAIECDIENILPLQKTVGPHGTILRCPSKNLKIL